MKKGLNASTLKMIAIIAMVIDHISWGFFDFYSWQGYMLHIIGRLTIPIMCFFIAEGFRKTHNLRRYILRMAFFAALSVIPFYLFFHEEYAYRQNVIFDYLLALLLLAVLESKRFKKPVKIMLSTLLVITSMVIGGWPVMPMIYVLIFYYADSFKKQAVWFCSTTVGLVLFMMIGITLNTRYNFYPMYNNWVWWDKSYFLGFMLALFLIKAYNGEKGRYPLGKYFFYLFYPVHFLVLFAIKLVINNYGSYWIYIGLQLFCILLVLCFICRIMFEKSSKAQNATVLLSVSGLVYTVAFFIETTARTKELAFGAVTMEYLGEAGAFLGATIFLSVFCHFRVKRWFYLIEGIFLGGAVILVYTAEYNHIFYKSIGMDFSGDFPRLILDYGIGFTIFYLFLMVLCVVATIKIVKSYQKASEIERKRMLLLLGGMCSPWLAIIVRSMGLTGGYEVSFLGIIFTAIFMILALIKYGYFDSVQLAVTNVIYKSNEGLLVLDNDKYVLYYNNIVQKIFPQIAERQSVKHVPVLSDMMNKCFDENGEIVESPEQNTIEADDRIYEMKTEPILEAGYIQGYMVRVFDYTTHYRSMEELRKTAHIDALTGLYDREIFKQEITCHLSNEGIGALFMVDIDFFKLINDHFGHIIGDEVLVSLSKAIRTVFVGEHIYCRVGGDEFMMFVKNTNDMAAIGQLAQELNTVYRENARSIAEGLNSSLSIGIALSASIPSDTESNELFEALYSLADKALYRVKENGKNGFMFYENMEN
ncbi:MAG: TraX family protein [Thermoflexaceae bacterium]|nr:TraX family protein [Thermoflexaceae bacterium]